MIQISRDDMIQLYYTEGLSLKKIANQLGCSDKTVKAFMIENNIEVQKRNLDEFSNEEKRKIEKLYSEGLNPREIGDEMGFTASKVKSYLVHNNIWIQMTPLEKKELKNMYQVQKLSIREIANKKNCSIKRIQIALKQFKIKKIYYKFNKEELELFYSKYHLSPYKIAQLKNSSAYFVKKAIKEYNIA